MQTLSYSHGIIIVFVVIVNIGRRKSAFCASANECMFLAWPGKCVCGLLHDDTEKKVNCLKRATD